MTGGIGVALVAAVLVLALSDVGARLPDGARVDGVAVGGMSPADAERAVARHARTVAAGPVLVFGPRRNVRTTGTVSVLGRAWPLRSTQPV